MRTIDGLFREIHEADPMSQVSRNFLRQLVISGRVKSVKAGNRYLCDLQSVLNYLENPPEENEESKVVYGKLRKING